MRIVKFCATGKIAILIGCLALLTASGGEAGQISNHSVLDQLRHFNTLSEQERKDLIDDDAGRLQKIQEVLISNLGSKNEDTRFYAAYLLGIYRFSEAAKVLAPLISMEDKVRPVRRSIIVIYGTGEVFPYMEHYSESGAQPFPP